MVIRVLLILSLIGLFVMSQYHIKKKDIYPLILNCTLMIIVVIALAVK